MTRKSTGAPGQRQLRVGEELRHALVGIIAEGHVRDPELASAKLTVTEVKVSPDLRNATIFVTPFGGGGDGETLLKALKRAAAYLRGELAHRVRLKFAPALRFELDRRFDEASRIEQLLKSPAVARDLASGKDGEE
ncbi:MAG: 30S ribosome-binding factor RbfA [Proteobacteria bacterium]|nr:30S ribosome-binding factor RbfA [Pseudomonadota bacterium]MBI3499028.1 30S ribosome-binding factor RbfA [Pseudomonadota bacterium]